MKSPSEVIANLTTKQQGEEFLNDPGYSKVWKDEFRRKLLKRESINLTLAFQPSEDFLLFLKKWFEVNMGQEILIDLIIDEKIVGGAILICRNHYKDYSLISTIDQVVHHPVG